MNDIATRIECLKLAMQYYPSVDDIGLIYHLADALFKYVTQDEQSWEDRLGKFVFQKNP